MENGLRDGNKMIHYNKGKGQVCSLFKFNALKCLFIMLNIMFESSTTVEMMSLSFQFVTQLVYLNHKI